VDFGWVQGGDAWRNPSSRSATRTTTRTTSTDNEQQSNFLSVCHADARVLAAIFCFLFLGIPVLAAFTLVVLRNTMYVTEPSFYTDEGWIGIGTPILFSVLCLLMTLPYACLFAFWMRDRCTRLLFWSIHIVMVAAPLALLLPLRSGYLTETESQTKLWTAHLSLIAAIGVLCLMWMLILHASVLAVRSFRVRMIDTVLNIGCIGIPAILLVASHTNKTFGAAFLVSDSNSDSDVGLDYGSGILLSTLVFGVVTSAWLSIATRWWIRTDVSGLLVGLMTIDVVCIIAPLGGTALGEQIFPQVESNLGKSTQGWCVLLAITGVLLLGVGPLSRLTLFVENASFSMLIVSEFCYVATFAIPVPLMLPLDILKDFQSGKDFHAFAVAVLVGAFLFVWCLATYVDVTYVRQGLLVELGVMEEEEEEEEEEEQNEAAIVQQQEEINKKKEEETKEVDQVEKKRSFLGGKVLEQEDDKRVEAAANTMATTEDGNGKVKKNEDIMLLTSSSCTETSVRSQERKKALQDPLKFIRERLHDYVQKIWLIPSSLYFVLVCPSIPTMIVMTLSPHFSDLFYPNEFVIFQRTCQTMAVAGVLSLFWIGYHGPVMTIGINFATQAHGCRPVPNVASTRMELTKSGLFGILVLVPTIVLVPIKHSPTARLVCIPMIVVGLCLIAWLEIGYSETLQFWSDMEERIVLSALWLCMIMIPAVILLPDCIERLIVYILQTSMTMNNDGQTTPSSSSSSSSSWITSTTSSNFSYLDISTIRVLGTSLMLGLMWMPYILYRHAHHRGEKKWYQVTQSMLYVACTISIALLATSTVTVTEDTMTLSDNTSFVNGTTTVIHHGNIAANTTIILTSGLLMLWLRLAHHVFRERIPTPDIVVLSTFVISFLIFPISMSPTVYIDEIAYSVFIRGGASEIAAWRETMRVLLVGSFCCIFPTRFTAVM
jgi:hypothetical protein